MYQLFMCVGLCGCVFTSGSREGVLLGYRAKYSFWVFIPFYVFPGLILCGLRYCFCSINIYLFTIYYSLFTTSRVLLINNLKILLRMNFTLSESLEFNNLPN